MKSQPFDPALYVKHAGELPLSGPALTELLRAVLDKGVPFRFQAKGFSMSPFVRNGDVVTVAPLAGGSPRFGDVVAFLHLETGKLAVHRVVGRRGDAWLIRGDNAPDADGLIPKANLLGRVTRVERDGRRVDLGLGPERFLIALLNRRGRLSLLWRPWRLL